MKITFKVKCPICNREVQGKVMSPVHPGPEHAFICPYWREDPEENSGPLDDVVTEALKTEGFGVVVDIDVQASMKKKPMKTSCPTVSLASSTRCYAGAKSE